MGKRGKKRVKRSVPEYVPAVDPDKLNRVHAALDGVYDISNVGDDQWRAFYGELTELVETLAESQEERAALWVRATSLAQLNEDLLASGLIWTEQEGSTIHVYIERPALEVAATMPLQVVGPNYKFGKLSFFKRVSQLLSQADEEPGDQAG